MGEHTRVRGSLTAMIGKQKQVMYMLTKMHKPPAGGNFCDDQSSHRLHK
jgi:hypothetical protein